MGNILDYQIYNHLHHLVFPRNQTYLLSGIGYKDEDTVAYKDEDTVAYKDEDKVAYPLWGEGGIGNPPMYVSKRI